MVILCGVNMVVGLCDLCDCYNYFFVWCVFYIYVIWFEIVEKGVWVYIVCMV